MAVSPDFLIIVGADCDVFLSSQQFQAVGSQRFFVRLCFSHFPIINKETHCGGLDKVQLQALNYWVRNLAHSSQSIVNEEHKQCFLWAPKGPQQLPTFNSDVDPTMGAGTQTIRLVGVPTPTPTSCISSFGSGILGFGLSAFGSHLAITIIITRAFFYCPALPGSVRLACRLYYLFYIYIHIYFFGSVMLPLCFRATVPTYPSKRSEKIK